jgi:hypothetical protein
MSAVAQLRVIETGVAFLTGVEAIASATPVSPEALASAGLRPLQITGPAEGRYFRTTAADHGTNVIASAFATADPDSLAAALVSVDPVDGWVPAEASIVFHDFGVGTAWLTWESTRTSSVLDEETGTHLDALGSASAELLEPLIRDAAARLAQCFPAAPSPEGVVALLHSVHDSLPPYGKILWTWSHVRCSVPAAADHERAARTAAEVLCPNDFHVLRHRDHTYVAGVAVSVTCSHEERFSDGIALSRALPSQDAWWALIWALDRALLALQVKVDAGALHEPVRVLSDRARSLERVTSRIQLLRSRLDSILMNVGARELAAWETLATAWALETRVESVKRKLEFLQGTYQSVVDESSRRRSEQISIMIYLFTAVSVIASAVAVVQYAQGTPATDAVARLGVIVVCMLAAAAAVVSTMRAQQLRRRRDTT